MALFTVSVENDDIDAFVDELNAVLAGLTSVSILSFDLFGIVLVWNRPPMWTVLINYQDGAPTTTPFVVTAILGDTLQLANADYVAFRTAHPSEFVSGPIAEVPNNENVRTHGPSQSTLILVATNADPSAITKWPLVSGGAATPSGPGVYTNAVPTPDALGGIPAGSTFLNQTMQQMFDALLYPYQSPAFLSFSISGIGLTLEVGDTIPAPVTFLWTTSNPANIVASSLTLLDITVALTLASGVANDGTEAVTQPGAIMNTAAATHTYRITGQNSDLVTFTRDLTFTWEWRKFYGTGAFQVPSGAQIQALVSNALSTGYPGSYSFLAGGYKFICVSNALGGQINSVKDSATLFDVPMATVTEDPAYSNVDGGGFSYALVSVTNGFSVTNTYRVYRSFNTLGASITFLVT